MAQHGVRRFTGRPVNSTAPAIGGAGPSTAGNPLATRQFNQSGGGQGISAGAVGGAGPSTTFGPGNNLINRQFNPTASGRLQGTQGQTNVAAGNVAGFQQGQFQGVQPGQALGGVGGPNLGAARNFQGRAAQNIGGAQVGGFQGIGGGAFGPQADTAAARSAISADLGDLRGRPGRAELAQQAFSQIQESGEPAFQKSLQNVGRRAASLGRIGAGQTTSELGDVLQNRERDLDLVRRGLATEAAGQEIGDRFNQLQATQGAAGQLFGQDVTGSGVQQGLRQELRGERGQQFGQELAGANLGLARGGQLAGLGGQEAGFQGQELGARERERGFQFGQGQALRGEARGERGARQQFGQQGFQNQLAQLGAISGLEGQQFGQERAGREELRGERGFQFGADQTAQDRRIQQRVLEEQFLNSQFGRNQQQQELLARLGFSGQSLGNLGNRQQQFAGSLGGQAGQSLGAAAGAFRNLGRGGPPPGPLPTGPNQRPRPDERFQQFPGTL